MNELPVVIIGAGPQGLAAAAHVLERGMRPLVLEQGEQAAAAVRQWGHVRLFSGWGELIDSASRRLLVARGWRAPKEAYPTGSEWVAEYLHPLAEALGEHVRTGVTVTGISRVGRDKVVDAGRGDQPFVVHVIGADGVEERIRARFVIDASGTWSRPNPAGADGLAALGERAAAARIDYRIPERVPELAGAHVVVIGAGHSAIHALLRVGALARTTTGTRVTWLLRRAETAAVFGTGDADALQERAALGSAARRLVEDGVVQVETGFRVSEFRDESGGLTVVAEDGREVRDVQRVFALTGFRPDTRLVSELRVSLDPALEAVAGIAAEIDPNIHTCGTVAATGSTQLAQPEPGFFIVGAKSYGRAPTFLALTGYEQVRSVVAHLAGDLEAAARNELVLPETGACGGAGAFDDAEDASCCARPLIQLGARPEGASV